MLPKQWNPHRRFNANGLQCIIFMTEEGFLSNTGSVYPRLSSCILTWCHMSCGGMQLSSVQHQKSIQKTQDMNTAFLYCCSLFDLLYTVALACVLVCSVRHALSPCVLFLTVENETHCDFVKLREMLIRVNMEDLREQTHTRHYELYRRCKLEEMGFKDTDPDSKPFR